VPGNATTGITLRSKTADFDGRLFYYTTAQLHSAG
jgi:hypothetical protein